MAKCDRCGAPMLSDPPCPCETDYFLAGNEYEEGDDENAEAEMNCGEMPDGGCSLAGTEYCDWSCPFSDGMVKRMNEMGRVNNGK